MLQLGCGEHWQLLAVPDSWHTWWTSPLYLAADLREIQEQERRASCSEEVQAQHARAKAPTAGSHFTLK